MARAGAVWLDVLPNLSLFNKLVTEGTSVSLGASGTKAGREYGNALRTSTKQSTAGIGALVAAEMQRGAAEAASAVDAASGKVEAARKREADAAGRLRVAESKLADSRAKGNASASSVVTAEERVAAAERGVEVAAAGATGATKSLERAQATAAAQSEVSSKRMSESSGKMSLFSGAAGRAHSAVRGLGGAFVGMLGITAAFEIGKFAEKSVAAAGDFQKSMNLLVTAGGESQTAIGLVSSGIKSIAIETGTATGQLAEGMYTVEKAGFRGAGGLKVLRAAAQAAADEQVGLGVMTNGLTSIMRSYNIPASGVVSVTNMLVAASGRAKSTMQDFAGSLSTVLPIASQAGISFAQVAGAVATLTSHGTSAQEATQHLAFTIRNLQSPNLVAQKMMAQFGLTALDVSRNLGKRGLSGTLDLISESILRKMGPSGVIMLKTFNQSKDAASAATTMFGKLSPAAQKLADKFMAGGISVRGFSAGVNKNLTGMDSSLAHSWLVAYTRSKGFNDSLKLGTTSSRTYQGALLKIVGGAAGLNTALQLTGGSASYLHESIKLIGDAGKKTGNDISVWAQTQKTFNIQLARFKEGLAVAGINLGTKLLPPLTWLLRHMVELPGWLSKNVKALKDWALGFSGVRAVLGIAGSMLASLFRYVKEMPGWLSKNKGALKTWADAIGLVTAAFVVLDITGKEGALTSMPGTISKIVQATKAWAVETRILNTVQKANWIGIIIVAIGLLVAGFIYAFHHSKTFHDGVMAALHGVAAAGKWMWEKALKPAFHGLKVAFFAVGDAAVWLWKHGIKPAFDGISSAASWLYHKALLPAFHGIQKAVSAVGAAASWLWKNILHPTFSAIGSLASWLWNKAVKPAFADFKAGIAVLGAAASWLYTHIFKPVFTVIGVAIKIAWNIAKGIFILFKAGFILLGMGAAFLYEKAIKPALHGIASLIGWLWTNVAKPIFHLISAGWGLLGSAVDWVWKHVLSPAMHGVASLIDWLWKNIAKPIFELIGAGFKLLGEGVKWVWDHVIHPAISAVGSLIGWLWNKVGKPIFGLVGKGFSLLGAGLKWDYDKVIHPALKAFGDMGTWLWTKAIKPALGFIAGAFKALRKHIADPINFVIGTIYDDGIRKFFNAVATATGQSTRLDYIAPVKLSRGGPARGAGTATSDSIPAMLSNNEHVWTAREVRNAGGHAAMERMRADYRFANGGPVIFQPTTSGQQNPTYPGHSGIDFFGRVGDAIIAAVNSRISYTGAGKGYGDAIFATAADGLQMVYGHTSAILAQMGQVVQGGQRIGSIGYSGNVRPPGPAGAHLHFEVAPGGQFDRASNRDATAAWLKGADVHHYGGGGGPLQRLLGDVLSGPLGLVKRLVSGLLGHLPGGGLGIVGQAAKNLPGMALGWAESFFGSHGAGASAPGGNVGPVGSGVGRWGPTVRDAMARTGMPPGTFPNWMQQIQTESSGNPSAIQGAIGDVNNRSGDLAEGLIQVIGATFARYRDQSLPNDRFNPLANLVAGMNYAKDRYGLGSVADVIGHGHGYATGTQSALPGWARVGENGPELVKFHGGEKVMNASNTRAASFRTANNAGRSEGVGVIDYDRLAAAMGRVHIDLDGRNVARSMDRRLGAALA